MDEEGTVIPDRDRTLKENICSGLICIAPDAGASRAITAMIEMAGNHQPVMVVSIGINGDSAGSSGFSEEARQQISKSIIAELPQEVTENTSKEEIEQALQNVARPGSMKKRFSMALAGVIAVALTFRWENGKSGIYVHEDDGRLSGVFPVKNFGGSSCVYHGGAVPKKDTNAWKPRRFVGDKQGR